MNKKSKKILTILFMLLIIVFPRIVLAEQLENNLKNKFSLQTSLMTRHWDNDSNTNNVQELVGLEYYPDNTNLYGLAYFKNSAFQSAWYFYKGKIMPWKQINDFQLYGKLTYGVITGYDDEEGKYNAIWYKLGTFPGVLPSIGVEYKFLSLEVSFFADQGFIAHGGVKF